MKHLIFAILIVGLFLIAGCSSSFAIYTDESGYFSISYPEDWTLFPSNHTEAKSWEFSRDFFKSYTPETYSGVDYVFAVVSPKVSGINPAKVTVIVESMKLEGLYTLDEIVNSKTDHTKSLIQGEYDFSRTNTDIDGKRWAVINWEYKDTRWGENHSTLMLTTVDDLIWAVVCEATIEDFNEFKNDFNTMSRSLRIMK
jgi:hypothetical protein